MNKPTLRVVIADDEILARQRLQDLLAARTDVEIVAMAQSGPEAVEAIRTHAPDLVLLDIHMQRMNGFDVIRTVGTERMPVTILVTAFNQHAIEAFEAAALDYLLKPFTRQRFEQALARARDAVQLRQAAELAHRMLGALARQESTADDAPQAAPAPAPDAPRYVDRLAVESRSQVRVVDVRDIDYISASGVYAELHVGEKTYVMRETLQSLQARLDPRSFFRVHRSAIAQLDRIELLLREAGGDYSLKLKNGAQISVSRAQVKELERWMGSSSVHDDP